MLQIVDALRAQLGDNLTNIILHGSLSFGCYYIPKSDIDILCIIKSPLSENEAREALRTLATLNDARPHIGALESSIVLQKDAHVPQHPIPYELHFSEKYAEAIKNNTYNYDQRSGRDPDLAAHFTVARKRGINLIGDAPERVLGQVAWKDFLDAVMDDLNWIIKDENILETPFYGVLNACRVLMTLQNGEGTVVSKEEGGLWALKYLPPSQHPVIIKALDVYRSSSAIKTEQRRLAGVEWDATSLLSFRDYIRNRLLSKA